LLHLGREKRRSVRAAGGHRVVRVATADDARHERDVLPREPVLGRMAADGGATVVSGNESFNLSGPGSHSLYLPSGSSATSPAMCVETLDVFARYVAKN
jgi:hypothetical protein